MLPWLNIEVTEIYLVVTLFSHCGFTRQCFYSFYGSKKQFLQYSFMPLSHTREMKRVLQLLRVLVKVTWGPVVFGVRPVGIPLFPEERGREGERGGGKERKKEQLELWQQPQAYLNRKRQSYLASFWKYPRGRPSKWLLKFYPSLYLLKATEPGSQSQFLKCPICSLAKSSIQSEQVTTSSRLALETQTTLACLINDSCISDRQFYHTGAKPVSGNSPTMED